MRVYSKPGFPSVQAVNEWSFSIFGILDEISHALHYRKRPKPDIREFRGE